MEVQATVDFFFCEAAFARPPDAESVNQGE
jgi:hypothetical protein